MEEYKVYLSCPVSVEQDKLDEMITYLKGEVMKVAFWDRNFSYKYGALESSDALVLALPNNKFNYRIDMLPRGCANELHRARKLGIPIFIIYDSDPNGLQTYETNIDEIYREIRGIADTYNTLNKKVRIYEAEQVAIEDKRKAKAYLRDKTIAYDIETRGLGNLYEEEFKDFATDWDKSPPKIKPFKWVNSPARIRTIPYISGTDSYKVMHDEIFLDDLNLRESDGFIYDERLLLLM